MKLSINNSSINKLKTILLFALLQSSFSYSQNCAENYHLQAYSSLIDPGRSAGWNWQLSKLHPNDDGKAFQELFQLLEIFKSAQKTVVSIGTLKKITLDHSTAIWIEGNLHEKVIDQWCLSEDEYNMIVKELRIEKK